MQKIWNRRKRDILTRRVPKIQNQNEIKTINYEYTYKIHLIYVGGVVRGIILTFLSFTFLLEMQNGTPSDNNVLFCLKSYNRKSP